MPDKEKEELKQTNQKLQSQNQQLNHNLQTTAAAKSDWQVAAMFLGIGVVVVLVVGTALGSSARKHAQKQKDQQGR